MSPDMSAQFRGERAVEHNLGGKELLSTISGEKLSEEQLSATDLVYCLMYQSMQSLGQVSTSGCKHGCPKATALDRHVLSRSYLALMSAANHIRSTSSGWQYALVAVIFVALACYLHDLAGFKTLSPEP